MKSFHYTIQDEMGIHARPAGLLMKEAKPFASKITLSANRKSIDAKKLFAIMSLAIKKGAEVTMTIEGPDEADAAAKLEEFFKANL